MDSSLGTIDRKTFELCAISNIKRPLPKRTITLPGLQWSMASLPAMISPSSTLIDTSLLKSPAYFC